MKNFLLNVLPAVLCLLSFNSTAQVTLLSNNTNLSFGFVLNDKALLFSDDDSLWVTDGTPAGTVKLVNTVSYSDTAGGIVFNGKFYFTGLTAANGSELWVTDGTPAGTQLLKDIIPGPVSGMPTDFHINSINSAMLFVADDGINGRELWTSVGTNAGTLMLKDINPGAPGSFNFNLYPQFHNTNGITYFIANDGTNGTELWRTDNSTVGTTLVKDITPGATSTQFDQFINLGTTQIFGITAGSFFTSTFQLWRSDGTNDGTTMIKDFGTFSWLFPKFLFPFNNKIYLNGTDYEATGNELWVTDGSIPGTQLVKDINPGGMDTSSFPLLFNAVVINNKFYFTAQTIASGGELWMSDGTNAGTTLLKEINPDTASSDAILWKNYDPTLPDMYGSTLYNGKVFFNAKDGTNGNELWITDGTFAGTVMVKDIMPGAGNSIADGFFSYFYTRTGMYFAADNGSGIEPWVSDGTNAGTARVADVNPGAGGSDPMFLFIFNNQLYFNGTNGDHPTNTDLFKIDAIVSALPVTLLNFSAALTSNAVKLNWTTTNEMNSSHFIIERSIDGFKFNDIARINSKGNVSTSELYTHLDEDAVKLNNTTIFYRLKQVDKDGAVNLSKVLVVRLRDASLQFTFSPNPVQKQLNVMISPAGAKNIVLRIIDAGGKQVYQQQIKSGISTYQQNIDVNNWQKGVYYIQLIIDDRVKTGKFIKQ